MDKLKNKIQEQMHQMNVDEPNASTWATIKNHLEGVEETDFLKKHIAENKNELEIETPAAVWRNIKKNKVEKPVLVLHIKKRMLYLSAACIAVIVAFGIVRYIYLGKSTQNYEVVQKDRIKNEKLNDTTSMGNTAGELTRKKSLPYETIRGVVKEKKTAVSASASGKKQKKDLLPQGVRQIERDYNELIAAQIKYTRSLAIYGESAGYFEQFKNDFKLLEKQEKELRMSIAKKGIQENSITDLAMIYQEKLTVLKKLQTEIKKTSTRNKNLTDTIPAYINL